MTDTPQSPTPAQAGDVERLAEIRASVADKAEMFFASAVEFLLRLLDARDARIAELERTGNEYFRLIEDQGIALTRDAAAIKRLTTALSDQRVLAADAQRGNAATIGRLREALEAIRDHHNEQATEWSDAEWGDADVADYHHERAAFVRAALGEPAAAAEREPGR